MHPCYFGAVWLESIHFSEMEKDGVKSGSDIWSEN